MAGSDRPLKRIRELQPFSREHHHALVFCRNIGKGLSNGTVTERIKHYANYFYQNDLLTHFDDEEKFIFPILGRDHDLIGRAMNEHRTIHQLFRKTSDTGSLTQIKLLLDAHIRFEERVLFPEIQKVATTEQLQSIEQHHQELLACENWPDPFWK